MKISSPIYALPRKTKKKSRGRPPKTGERLGSPKELMRKRKGWRKHPHEPGCEIQEWVGLWQSVLPGHPIKIVVVRRDKKKAGKKKRLCEAYFSTNPERSAEDILKIYSRRWKVEIDIRDSAEFYGLAKNQCRRHDRIIGANSFCQIMAALRALWFFQQLQQSDGMDLQRYRPWYPHKTKPSQLDIETACKESLNASGVFPITRFLMDLPRNSTKAKQAAPQ